MDESEHLLLSVQAAPASDTSGFVGVVAVGRHEAYRTIRSYPSPQDALQTTQHLLAGALGALMADQEWRTAFDEYGHAGRRTDLGHGLRAPKQPRGLIDRRGENPNNVEGPESQRH